MFVDFSGEIHYSAGMLPLLRHLARNHLDEIVQKSFLNCHAFGVDSLMFCDTPGKTIRMFIAGPEHRLWTNHPLGTKSRGQGDWPMSVAIHPHRRDLTLVGFQGMVQNLRYELDDKSSGPASNGVPVGIRTRYAPKRCCKFSYRSEILDGRGGFQCLSAGHALSLKLTDVLEGPGAYVSMDAKDLHTVFVKKGETAAWIVLEAHEDPSYENVCYSDAALDMFSSDGMYLKPSTLEVLSLLERLDIL